MGTWICLLRSSAYEGIVSMTMCLWWCRGVLVQSSVRVQSASGFFSRLLKSLGDVYWRVRSRIPSVDRSDQ
jgi:hypothetical protein